MAEQSSQSARQKHTADSLSTQSNTDITLYYHQFPHRNQKIHRFLRVSPGVEPIPKSFHRTRTEATSEAPAALQGQFRTQLAQPYLERSPLGDYPLVI